MTRRSISNSFTVNTVEDGESAPFYNDEWYAWSNDESTASVTTAPTIAGEWSHTIPSQGSYAYLWKKVVRYDWQNSTRTYVEGAAQYFRMSGTNGTSINVKGTIEYAYNSRSGFPSPSSSITGYRAVAKEDNRIWICQQVAQDAYDWVPNGGTASDGFSYTIVQGNFNGNLQSTSNLTGHLVMWSDEASDWVDLGRFKGENGVTYYTHIAWATSVGYDNQGNVTRVTGFVTVKLASDTTHIWMGVLIDTNAGQDSSNKLLYTWSNTKGNKGDKGDKGDIGRFFYFGGVWEEIESTDTFVLNDAQAPYFEHTDNGQKKYHVYNPENSPSGGTITKAVMAQTSFSNAPWEAMTNDFKYIITEALFANFAKLGSAVFSGDFMMSQYGTQHGYESNDYQDFDPEDIYDNSGNCFCPSVLVNWRTGYAHFGCSSIIFNADGSGSLAKGAISWTSGGKSLFTGGINATSGEISGNLNVTGSLQLGDLNANHIKLWKDVYGGNITMYNSSGTATLGISTSSNMPRFWARRENPYSEAYLESYRLHLRSSTGNTTFLTNVGTGKIEVGELTGNTFQIGVQQDGSAIFQASTLSGNSSWPEYSYQLSPDTLSKGSVQVMSLGSLKALFDSTYTPYSDRLSKLSVLLIRNNT